MKPLYPVRSRTYRQECRVYSGHRNEPFMQVSKEPQMKSAISYPAFSIQKHHAARPLHLTPRELDVLALLCEGLPNKLISRRLNISAATVKCHISRILDELGVSSRLQAVVVAARFGLIADASEPLMTPRTSNASVPREAAGERSLQSRAFVAAVA
jgi:DNA-binding CsgD family transcriptional regulator